MNSKILPLCLFICMTSSLFAQVIVNEFSASNLNDFIDSFEKTEDWIELYNTSDSPVDISGWFLSDKPDNPEKWMIPTGTSIAANGYLVFSCSGRDMVVNNEIHTNFKLTQTEGADFIVFSDASGTLLESYDLSLTLLGHSNARTLDGVDQWAVCTMPSYGMANDSVGMYNGYTVAPTMDLIAGFYDGSQTISIQNNEPNSILRYTTDGHAPTVTSAEYVEPITIDETRTLKARSFSNDVTILPGKIDFNTYFIDESFTLPVFSVAADEVQDLANGNGDLFPIGSIEYFENEERTAISYGELNRHGQDSWALPHRSIDWVSRDEMGYTKSVKDTLFSYSDRDDHQRCMFRASGDDNYPAVNDNDHEGSCHVRDEYVHTLALEGGMKVEVRAVERVIVFLNGDYWGLYGLRERPVDHDYTKYYFDQEKFDLQYLLTWGNSWAEYGGDQAFDDWAEVRDFALENDLGDPENYEYIKDNIRLLSLCDYMIANLNSVASDWLNYNTGWWRGLNPDGDRKKWGYILWDNDATFDYYINYSGVPNTDPDAEPCDINDISDYMDEFFDSPWGGGEDEGKHEKIFLKLQEESETFRQLYYSRQADLMNTVYTCENMLETFDRMIDVIEPEMPRQIDRWGGSMQEWGDNVADMRAFIEERCTLLDDGMVNCFELDGPYDLTLQVDPVGAGEIDLNTLSLTEFPWTGAYFGGMNNLIEANSLDPNLSFLYWESSAGNVIFPEMNAAEASIVLTEADTLTAVFGIPSGTIDKDEIAMNAFPMPAKDFLAITYSLDKATDIKLSLHSAIGEEILQTNLGLRTSGFQSHTLDLKPYELATGMYFLTLKAGDAVRTLKVSIAN